MTKRTFAALALASAISTALHAAPTETPSTCFLDESRYSSFGSTYQFNSVTAGAHGADNVVGFLASGPGCECTQPVIR